MTEKKDQNESERVTIKSEELEKLKAERAEYLEGWKRAKADYENLQKETERERAEFADWANEQVLLRLLPAYDQFEVAMSFTPELKLDTPEDQKAFENWTIGLEAVRSLWKDAGKDFGLDKIDAAGTFNPELHEAVGEEESDSVPPGEIIRVTSNGYRLNGRVIRCAKVVLSK